MWEVPAVRDVITMWKHTKMVVLVALTAAVYAAILIPFKIATLIPGFTEIRPASAIPIVFGLLFGPAAAWGSAFGNLVGDLQGTLTPGSIVGFFGNFLAAYVPYRVWRALRGNEPAKGTPSQIGALVASSLAGAVACSVFIGTGVAAMGLVPYGALTTAITINNGLIGTVLALILLPILYPRAYQWGLIYTDLLDQSDYREGRAAKAGVALLVGAGGVGALLGLGFFAVGLLAGSNPDLQKLGASVLPVPVGAVCSLLIIIGTIMMSPFGRAAARSDSAQPGAEEEP